MIQTKQKRAGREQRNKYKPRTETSTKQEQTQEQHLTIRHAGRPADYIPMFRGSLNVLQAKTSSGTPHPDISTININSGEQ